MTETEIATPTTLLANMPSLMSTALLGIGYMMHHFADSASRDARRRRPWSQTPVGRGDIKMKTSGRMKIRARRYYNSRRRQLKLKHGQAQKLTAKMKRLNPGAFE